MVFQTKFLSDKFKSEKERLLQLLDVFPYISRSDFLTAFPHLGREERRTLLTDLFKQNLIVTNSQKDRFARTRDLLRQDSRRSKKVRAVFIPLVPQVHDFYRDQYPYVVYFTVPDKNGVTRGCGIVFCEEGNETSICNLLRAHSSNDPFAVCNFVVIERAEQLENFKNTTNVNAYFLVDDNLKVSKYMRKKPEQNSDES